MSQPDKRPNDAPDYTKPSYEDQVARLRSLQDFHQQQLRAAGLDRRAFALLSWSEVINFMTVPEEQRRTFVYRRQTSDTSARKPVATEIGICIQMLRPDNTPEGSVVPSAQVPVLECSDGMPAQVAARWDGTLPFSDDEARLVERLADDLKLEKMCGMLPDLNLLSGTEISRQV